MLFAVKPILVFYVGNSVAPVVEHMAVQWGVLPKGLQEPSLTVLLCPALWEADQEAELGRPRA